MTNWAGTDSTIGKYVHAESKSTLKVYKLQPALVDEHANLEDDIAYRGYPDRQIVELVQNASDQLTKADSHSKKRIFILLTPSTLYVADDGGPVDTDGASSLLRARLLSKRHIDEIGRFGVGFKSVLAVTDSPGIFSRTGSFVFNRDRAKHLISRVVENARRSPVLRIAEPVCPLTEANSDPVLSDLMKWAVNIVRLPLRADTLRKLADQISTFRAEFLLFVPHVRRLDMHWRNDTLADVESRELELENQDRIIYELRDRGTRHHWKLFRQIRQLSLAAKRNRGVRDTVDQVRITWAVPLGPQTGHHHFWAFFPTEIASLVHGIFNAPWKTTENRQHLLALRGNDYNSELIDFTALLVAEELTQLRNKNDPALHLDYLGGRAEYWLNEHALRLANRVYSALRDTAVVPDLDGRLRSLDDILIPPDLIEDELIQRWTDYEHRPPAWLHPSALKTNRLATINRIWGASATAGSSAPRTSVATWLETLTQAGWECGDEVRASKTAIIIAASIRRAQRQLPVGEIVLTADGGWAAPGPSTVHLSGAGGETPRMRVHSDLESDHETMEALKVLGVAPLTREVKFRNLVNYYSTRSHLKFEETWWSEFWNLAHSIDQGAVLKSIPTSTRSERALRVLTVSGTWQEIRHVLWPGSIVPNDGTRDPQIAVDLGFHDQDLFLLETLGVSQEPTSDYRYDNLSAIRVDDYLRICRQKYRDRPLRRRPQEHLLNFRNRPKIGPTDSYLHLSDKGKASFTDRLLYLEETYEPWIMGHETSREHLDLEFRSCVTWFLEKHGLVQIDRGIYPLSDGLGEEPKNSDVQRWLLEHPKTHLIRTAFSNLSRVSEVTPLGDDEPTPITDEWPGLSGLVLGGGRLLLVRCDQLVGIDGQDVPINCVRVGDTVYLVRQDDEADELRAVLRELDVDVDQDRFDQVFRRETPEDVRARRNEVAEETTDAARLLKAVGEPALRTRLPPGLIAMLEAESDGLTGKRVAEAAIATYHTGALHEYRDSLDHLNPPDQWAGSARAVDFVRDLGFGVEWAGRRGAKRPPHEDVTGPSHLPRLHCYQERAVKKLRDLLIAPCDGLKNRGLLSMPTGSGKTRVAVESIIDAVREKQLQGNILWVADRDELCEQAVASWQQAWSAVGPKGELLRISRMWGGQNTPVASGSTQVIVATRQTLKARGVTGRGPNGPLNDVRLLVVDEAHGAIAPSFTSIMKELGLTFRRHEDEIYLLGLTATPYRGHNQEETNWLAGRFAYNRLDSGIFRSDDPEKVIRELQNMNVLAYADHDTIQGAEETLRDEELRQIRVKRLPWLPEAVERRIANDADRTRRIVNAYKERVRPNWPTLIFATSVEHAKTIASILQIQGFQARAVSGTTDSTVRRSVVERFRTGNIGVLVNYGVFREGFDAPRTRAIIVARPVYTPNLYFQMIGRGLRGSLNGGTDRCLILDVEDNIRNYSRKLAFSEIDWLWEAVRSPDEIHETSS